MSATQFRAIELAIIPRSPKLPSDISFLSTVADLSFCPVKSVERRVRADYIAILISETLVAASDELL